MAHWNAFECLVDAVELVRPQSKLLKGEKQKLIDEFVKKKSGQLTPGDIQDLYRNIVDPGFVSKARHALKICFPEQWDNYAHECFQRKEKNQRLYDIRNAINHGEIDSENPEELIRIESRFSVLWIIVWQMFARFVRYFPDAVQCLRKHTIPRWHNCTTAR